MYGNAFEQLNDDFFNLGEENPMSQNDELQQSVEAPLVPLIQHNGELHQINDKQPNYEAPVLLFDGEVYETTHIVVEKKEISVEGVPYAPLEVVQQMNSSTAAADPEQNGSMWIVSSFPSIVVFTALLICDRCLIMLCTKRTPKSNQSACPFLRTFSPHSVLVILIDFSGK
jgi:hypothetical protein